MVDNNDFEFNNVSVMDPEELAAIDALLKSTADAATAQIDFEAIKQRIVNAENGKKKTHWRSIWRYAAAFAACFLFCFGVFSLAKNSLKLPDGDVDIRNPNPSNTSNVSNGDPNSTLPPEDENTPEPFSEEIPDSYDSHEYVGTIQASKGASIEEFFPSDLPNYMSKQIDKEHGTGFAKGTDSKGNDKYFDSKIIPSAPYKLKPGEVGEFSEGDDCVFYWQFSEEECLCVRFFGFTIEESRKLFNDFIEEYFTQNARKIDGNY